MDIILKTAQHEAEGLRTKLIGLKSQEKIIPKRIPLSSVSDEHDLIDKAKSDLLEHRRKEKALLTKYTESSRLGPWN